MQIGPLDAAALEKLRKAQEEAKRDELLLKYLGPRGAKRWKDENAKLTAELEKARQTLLRPDMIEALERMRQRVAAETKPLLAAEYAMLGLERGATKREIKNAYRRMARKLHPDKGGSEADMKALNAAYHRLLKSVKE